jgi:hypothetical protein
MVFFSMAVSAWGGGIIPQAEKAKTGVMDASARLLLTSYAFLYVKTFSGFGKIET